MNTVINNQREFVQRVGADIKAELRGDPEGAQLERGQTISSPRLAQVDHTLPGQEFLI